MTGGPSPSLPSRWRGYMPFAGARSATAGPMPTRATSAGCAACARSWWLSTSLSLPRAFLFPPLVIRAGPGHIDALLSPRPLDIDAPGVPFFQALHALINTALLLRPLAALLDLRPRLARAYPAQCNREARFPEGAPVPVHR